MVSMSALHCSVQTATWAEREPHTDAHAVMKRAEVAGSLRQGVLLLMHRCSVSHQEPIVVARQLDGRVVEPPRHTAEVLRARLPVGRPAHEAALQQRISAWSAMARS